MKFIIEKIILWPKKQGYTYRTVDFSADKINIITGASRTGKSALIPIIDYCLGSNKCSIPVDTIRNATAWFGVLFSLNDEQILLCRKEPGEQVSSNEMFILRDIKVTIPNVIFPNTNKTEINNVLNELFSMSFLPMDSTIDSGFASRPSYRDFMAFLFQPQNIVANADVLFYKADTMEHRQKLISIFPYALGAITSEILAARQDLERLKKQRERIQRDLRNIKDVAEEWKQEVSSWLSQAKELGLLDKIDANLTFDEQLSLLSNIIQKNEANSQILTDNIRDMSDSIVEARKEERELSSLLFSLQKRYLEIKQLKESAGNYDSSLKIQMNRLEVSTWLKDLAKERKECPICNSTYNATLEDLEKLCEAIREIERSTQDIKSMPMAFERELQNIQKEMETTASKLNAVRKRLIEESGELNKNSDRKYTLSGISRFLGRMETSLKTFERIGKDGSLENDIARLSEKINKLSQIVNEVEIKKKQEDAIEYINQKIGEIVKTLDVEHPEDPVKFIIKDLTLKVKSEKGRDDYLWEIGSASNWLAYHISTLLAFQQFFQTRGKVSVPNFLIFDQPSQVYFPQRHSINESKDFLNDEDKEAVKKIFTCMDNFLKTTNRSIQLIVTEHADSDIWGDIDNIHLVGRWRGKNKLIPEEWL